MFRPMLGMKLAALAVGVVGTAGVAAAATVVQTPATHVAAEPNIAASVADLSSLPVDLPAGVPEVTMPSLPDFAAIIGSLPIPTVPTVPSVPGVPGTGSLPVDPADLAGSATEVATQVTALLPSPAELQAVVMGCVSDLAALAPVQVPDAADPLGFLSGLFGMFGGVGGGSLPAPPDPAAVQAAVTDCVNDILSLLPDPTALVSTLTTAFGGNLPGPVADLIAMITGEVGGAPDSQHLLDLVTSLTGATGSPTEMLDELMATLESVLPPQAAGLLALPLSIVHQVFAAIGLG